MLQFNANNILIFLRVAALIGQLSAIGAAYWVFGPELNIAPLLLTSAVYALWTGFSAARLIRDVHFSDNRMTFEITCDLVVIAVLMYFAGGWTNPFASIYLVPLAFAATLLSPVRAFSLGLGAFALYSLTTLYHQPLPSVDRRFGGDFNLHVVGMWVGFTIAAVVLIASVSLERRAFERERAALARARESRLRDEQLLLIGVLAASTAHELGTPLSTARMLVDELMQDKDDIDTETMTTLAEQLDYAIEQLRNMVALADNERAGPCTLIDFAHRVADRFRTLHPEIELTTDQQHTGDSLIDDPRLLEGAVLSLLSNAATASRANNRNEVVFTYRTKDGNFELEIRDYGQGIQLSSGLGREAIRSSDGLGVGLVISSATFERYSGEARHTLCDPGTRVVVTLPLAALVEQDQV